MQLNIAQNADELNWLIAEWILSTFSDVLRTRDRITIALSGGSSPKKLYQLLATDEFKHKIDWQRLHIFWGDERFVPFNDDRNNAKMTFDSLLNHVTVPRSQIHIMRTDIDPDQSAIEYENILRSYFPRATDKGLQTTDSHATYKQASPDAQSPVTFDIVLLGLGDNAHTLSLFPGEDVIHEKESWVRSVFVKEVNMRRITLTAPVVNLSRNVAFLVSGSGKASAVSHVLSNDYIPDMYPAQLIKPLAGELYWFLDKAAAAMVRG